MIMIGNYLSPIIKLTKSSRSGISYFNITYSQFVQHYGSVAIPPNVEGGFYTDARGEARRSADHKTQRQIQKLNVNIPSKS